jgi:hypothetical protein
MDLVAFDIRFSNYMREFARNALAKAEKLKVPMVVPEMKAAKAKLEYIAAKGRLPPEESE